MALLDIFEILILKATVHFVHNDTKNLWICDICPSGPGKPKTIFSSKIAFEKHILNEKHAKNVE